jgi:Curli production assembly/transport component CsgG/PEGA domain
MFKSYFVFALVLTGLTYRCLAAETAAPIADKKRKVILVPPFENISQVKSMVVYEVATVSNPNNPKRQFHVDRYSEAPRAVLEDILQSIDGVTAVERTRVDAILLESEFGRLSGLVDSEKAAKIGKMLGANTIIMGSILDVTSTKKSFSGYGIRTDTVVVRCSIRVRIMEIESGNLTLSKIVRGSISYSSSNFGGVEASDVAYSVIESTLESLRDDSQFKTAVAIGKQSLSSGGLANVEVEFSPIPENSDIEIEGSYVGGSPLKKTLHAGKPVKLRVAKAGYKAWETTITPANGMQITKELERVIVEIPAK